MNRCMCTGEIASAADAVSNPSLVPSSGRRSRSGSGSPSRSWRVFSYSRRLSRRMATRPPSARRTLAATARPVLAQVSTAAVSALGGRSASGGGISPASTRVMIRSQRSAAVSAARSSGRSSIRMFPSGASPEWQSAQCCCRNAIGSAAPAWLASEATAIAAATMSRCAGRKYLTRFSSRGCGQLPKQRPAMPPHRTQRPPRRGITSKSQDSPRIMETILTETAVLSRSIVRVFATTCHENTSHCGFKSILRRHASQAAKTPDVPDARLPALLGRENPLGSDQRVDGAIPLQP